MVCLGLIILAPQLFIFLKDSIQGLHGHASFWHSSISGSAWRCLSSFPKDNDLISAWWCLRVSICLAVIFLYLIQIQLSCVDNCVCCVPEDIRRAFVCLVT